jgi:hypothetical protein
MPAYPDVISKRERFGREYGIAKDPAIGRTVPKGLGRQSRPSGKMVNERVGGEKFVLSTSAAKILFWTRADGLTWLCLHWLSFISPFLRKVLGQCAIGPWGFIKLSPAFAISNAKCTASDLNRGCFFCQVGCLPSRPS